MKKNVDTVDAKKTEVAKYTEFIIAIHVISEFIIMGHQFQGKGKVPILLRLLEKFS